MAFSADVLAIDENQELTRLQAWIRDTVFRVLRRRGVVVGLSGGIDSSVTVTLCRLALGAKRVLGLLMPDGESATESVTLARDVALFNNIETYVEDIAQICAASHAYERRDRCFRQVIPEYGEGWTSKIVLPKVTDGNAYRVFYVVAQSPSGDITKKRLPAQAYLGVVAASNFKQRIRKMMEYHHADRRVFAVAGTPNRLEYDQGFFVKGGDGVADFKPIAHLYKTQVYALARHLKLPEKVITRPPTTDTYSMPQGQDEFYFSLPYAQMDLVLYGKNHGVPACEIAQAVGLTTAQIDRICRDIDAKRRATRYLHLAPQIVDDIPELDFSR